MNPAAIDFVSHNAHAFKGTLKEPSHDRFNVALNAAAQRAAGSAPAGSMSGGVQAGAANGSDAPSSPPAAPPPADAPPADASPAMPSATDKRPAGDTRSAQEIIDGDPTLKNLGNQSGVKDGLKKQVGDFEHDPDAAFRASDVLKHIKSAKTSDGRDRSGDVTSDGKIEGFTKDGDARHGTEAGLLQDFGKHGYSALKDNQTLDKTKDGHVKKDGTNMDNTTFAAHEIVHGLSEAAGWIGKELDKLPGPLKSLLGPLHMISKAASGGLNVADAAVTGGDVKQAGKDMAHGLLSTGSGIIQGAADLVDATVGKVPGLGKLANAAVQPLATAASDGLHVADTAVEGGDVKQAAKQMGGDVAGSAVGSVVGLADPTGVASGAAAGAVANAVNKGGAPAGGSGGAPAGGVDMLSDALGALPGKKGKGSASESGGSAKGGASTDEGKARGGVSGDKADPTADRSPPKRTADDANLPGRADKKSKVPKRGNGTYTTTQKKNEANYLGIPKETKTQPKTHQSEHIAGFDVVHPDLDRNKNGSIEGKMPAYYEETQMHRDHAGTGTSQESISEDKNPETNKKKQDKHEAEKKDRLDRTGWSSGESYRHDQRAALQDPVARRNDAALSNAYQLNQLGYGQQAGHEARHSPGQSWPSADPKASDSYANTVRHDPALEHTLPDGTAASDRLGPHGQAEAMLAHEARTTGQWPTLERQREVRKQFSI